MREVAHHARCVVTIVPNGAQAPVAGRGQFPAVQVPFESGELTPVRGATAEQMSLHAYVVPSDGGITASARHHMVVPGRNTYAILMTVQGSDAPLLIDIP